MSDRQLSPPFAWMGGKSRLRATLATLIPEQDKPIKNRKLQLQLAEMLKDSKATWMLSYGDHAVIRDLYKTFHIKECTVKYSGLANSGENQYEAPELIITNYDPIECKNTSNLFTETT